VESNVAFSVFSYLKAALARPSSACCFVAARMVFMRAGYSIADGFASNRIARHRDIPNATLDLKALFCVRPCLLRPLVFHSQVERTRRISWLFQFLQRSSSPSG
jgi:hypothetical protein